VREGTLVVKKSATDKEFHFQNWFKARLRETEYHFEQGGRNSYPDFRCVEAREGYEVKGLAYPGRETDYDCNSQVPSGEHNGRSIYYVFGRYPAKPDGRSYPVLDLAICHGDFLNAVHDYVHKNRNVRGFGSYGDIMIRDRKMYVAPTPFSLTHGSAHQVTLIIPEGMAVADESLRVVGTLVRKEATKLIVGYRFDLRTNEITPETVPNPGSGIEHRFVALRPSSNPGDAVSMRSSVAIPEDDDD
jgi:hypothetical protein